MPQAPSSNFEYVNGNNPMKDIEGALDALSSFCNAPIFPTTVTLTSLTSQSLSSSFYSSVASGNPSTGSIAIVGTSPAKLYVFTGGGTILGLPGWQSASLGG